MKKIIDIKEYQKWFFDNWGQLGSVQDSIVKWMEEQPDYNTQTPNPKSQADTVHGQWWVQFRQAYEQFAQAQKLIVKWDRKDNFNLDDIITVLVHKTDGDYQKAFDGWFFILNKWDNLNPFLKDQPQISNIAKNLDEIIRKLSRHAKQSSEKGLGKWA